MHSSTPVAYAIDFGTTNSLIAAASADRVWEPIAVDPLASDPTVLRSVLFFPEDSGFIQCGAAALAASSESGMRGRLIRSIKRFLPLGTFTETRIGTRRYTLEELVAILLRNLRERANAALGTDVTAAVLGCPARFSDNPEEHELAITRLKKAAELSGFRSVTLCEEPVAAALDCASRDDASELVLVLDLGGGTSDFTVARLGGGRADVLSVGGIAVAGDAFDGCLMRECIAPHFGSQATYRRAFGENILRFPRPLLEKLCSPAELCLLDRRDALAFLKEIRSSTLSQTDRERMDRLLCVIEDRLGFRLFEAIDSAKRELSERSRALFRFDYPTIELELEIDRVSFQAASQPCLDRILLRLEETLAAARVNAGEIDGVYCTGGTAKVPAFLDAVSALFGAHKVRHVSTFHAVIQGLAERARGLVAEGKLN